MSQRSRRPVSIWSTTALVLLAVALTNHSGGRRVDASTSDVSATATREAELTEIASLRTEVASLRTPAAGQKVEDPLGARLGGSRASFRQALGDPTESDSPHQDRFAVSGVGEVTVTSVGDQAVGIAITPSLADPSTATAGMTDWSADEAEEIITRFAPADAIIVHVQPEPKVVAQTSAGYSEALTAAMPASGVCGGSDDSDFDVAVEFSEAPRVSTILLTIHGSRAAMSREVTPVATSQGGTVATVSLGGTTTVNGVRVSAAGVQRDAEGVLPTDGEERLIAIEVDLQNQTRAQLWYTTDDFRLTLEDGRELTAACGGVEPAVVSGTLQADEAVHGWVSFAVAKDAVPVRFTYLVGGSPSVRAGFKLP